MVYYDNYSVYFKLSQDKTVILKDRVLVEGYCSRVLMLLRQEVLHFGGFRLDTENREDFRFGILYLNCVFVT